MPEYKAPYPSTKNIPKICSECGSSIVDEPLVILTHTEWHEKIDELIDWAQHISNLFVKPAPQTEWEPGDPIE